MMKRIFSMFLVVLLMTSCQQTAAPAVLSTPTATSAQTQNQTAVRTDVPSTPAPAASATPQLVITSEPVNLSDPLILELSSRSCAQPIEVPPSQIYNPENGPQAIIAGGRVQSGEFTFGAWLYCSEMQPGPDPDQWNPYTNLRGLALYLEWMYEGNEPIDLIGCYHGFDPDIYPDRGWSADCGAYGGLGMGLQLPPERLDRLTAEETPLRYVFKAVLPDGQQQGMALSFTLRRANDGFLVTNVQTAQLSPEEVAASLPTLNPIPPPPGEHPFPLADINQLIDQLLADLNARDFEAVKAVMSEEFDFQFVPLDAESRGREAATQVMEFGQILAQHPQISRSPNDTRFRRNFPGSRNPAIYAVETTGWGLSGQGRGYLSVAQEEDGQLHWSRLLLYEASYSPLPWLETTFPPAGLIYQKDDLYFRVASDGTSQMLFGHEPPVGFNPDGTRAVFGPVGQNEITVLTFSPEDKRIVALDGYLLRGVDEAQWLDPQTILLALVDTQETAMSRGGEGYLALVDVTSGAQEDFHIPVSIDAQPSITSNGAILYSTDNGDLMQWREGQSQPFSLPPVMLDGQFLRMITSPVLSPDRTKLTGIASTQQGVEILPAYVVIDLVNQSAQVIQPFRSIPADTSISQTLIWSPDSRWLAIQSRDYDPIQNGVWLVSADGQVRTFLGTASSHPVWIDAKTLIFSYISEGTTRLQQYSVSTQTRSWLNLPAGPWLQDWGRGLPSVSAVQFHDVETEEE